MAWYDEARFYHIYPLGLLNAPKLNAYDEPVHRLKELSPWIDHIKSIGCNAIYIGPLFESVGHGYETTDYKKLDSRLGDNDDLKDFVKECHSKDVKVIFDGVFNHTGRDFFAFKDLQKNRENSVYKDWFCNVNFYGNNEYNDGFSYENWGGYNLLVKLNQRNQEVKDFIADVIKYWVEEFDVDGIRLDAADVLDFDFMKSLREIANVVKPDFWLMGEVIHGDYSSWVNEGTLHSVTNYQLHKALYSGHNDHNYYEIAHTVNRLYDMGGRKPDGLKLYNFVDNHDVERLYTKITKKEHFIPIHILMYTLPGVPSIYYGSEFGIEGKKENGSDDSLRPALNIEDYKDSIKTNRFTNVIAKLGKARSKIPALSYGYFTQLHLTNRQYIFSRSYNNLNVIVAVNNDDNDCGVNVGGAYGAAEYISVFTGEKVPVNNGNIYINIKANSGDIWVPNVENIFKMEEKVTVSEPEVTEEETFVEEIEAVEMEIENVEFEDMETVEIETENLEFDDLEAINIEPEELEFDAAEIEMEVAEFDDLEAVEMETEDEEPEDTEIVETETEDEEPEDTEIVETETEDEESEVTETVEMETEDKEPEVTETVEIETEKVEPQKPIIEVKMPVTQVVTPVVGFSEDFENGRIAGLQEAILAIMSKYGPVTEQMKKDVYEQTHIPSLINWVKSFN